MDAKENKHVLALKRHLQKYVRKLLTDIKEIETKEAESQKEVATLANLLEQTKCVTHVDVSGLPLASLFPDIQSRLLVKISAEVDMKLERLKNLIDPLKQLNTAADTARADAFNIIQKHPQDLNVQTLSIGQPTIPPLLVMLEWVDTVERQTREIYHTRLYYLENIHEREIISPDNVAALWSEDIPALFNTVKDCEELSMYFLNEKYD